MYSQAHGVETPQVEESSGDDLRAGRGRAGLRAVGTACAAALYRHEESLVWTGPRRPVVRVMPVLGVAGALFAVVNRPHASLAQEAVLVLGAVPLALVLSRPLLAWRIAFVAGVLGQLLGPGTAWPTNPVQTLVLVTTLFVVALTRARPVVLCVGVISLLGIVLALPSTDRPYIALAVLVMVAGDQIRQRRAVQERLAREQERSAVIAERSRIARELHDVVAHHMSLLAVRAETAPFRMDPGLSEPVRVEFAEIAAGARQALMEMRGVLGVLRSGDHDLPLAPQPGLKDLPSLVEADRAAGADVTLELEALPDLPDALGLTGYRVVQEALSNAARHAPGSPVHVVVRVARDAGGVGNLDIHVRNASPPGAASVVRRASSRGLGLVGMRERVGALGGVLTVGATDDGGFEVHAQLPFRPTP